MNIKIETISPKRAQEILDKHYKPERQRKPSPVTVSAYARAMTAGHWALNHQGIAISDEGELVDGVQRMMAVVQSGVTIELPVARGVSSNGVSHHGAHVIDTIDRGRIRSVGQQLALRHGITNGNVVAAATLTILRLACESIKVNAGRAEVAHTLRVLQLYGKEIEFCIAHQSSTAGFRSSMLIGSCALAMKSYPELMQQFYLAVTTGEDIKSPQPAYTLRKWMLDNPASSGGGYGEFRRIGRAVMYAAMKHVKGESITRVNFSSESGYTFFIEKQRVSINKLLIACGYLAPRTA